MPITCEFQLNNQRATYFTGKTFAGSIILTTTSDKDIRNIRIRFLGKAKVYWNNTRLYGRFISSIIASENYAYKCEETYVHQQVIARGKGTLLTGCHSPVSAEESYYPTCFTLASGKISFEFTLPFRGFASGQILPYSLQISNQSMIDISGYKLELVEAITYIAKHPYYKERKKRWVLAKAVFMDPCLRLTNRQFNRSLQLPSIAPSCRNQCIIQWQHLLELKIIAGGCFGNKSVAIPIVIGSVPLIESVQEECQENFI
uniref:Arrestin_C domain-containing protein n=1 Tax=Musca domestica TaxID=7370 RepID=A0A1I8N780_MUSDO